MTKKGGVVLVPIDAGIGATDDVHVSRIGTAWRAVYNYKDKKIGMLRRAFRTRRPSVEAVVKQLAHAKLAMMSEAELTRLVNKM